MKKMTLFFAGLGIFFSIPSFASFFESCNVTAKVVSVEELSVFGTGSSSVPKGLNPDGKEVYSFVNLLTVEVKDVDEMTSNRTCDRMVDNSYRVVLQSKDFAKSIQPGEELKLHRRVLNSLTPKGVAYGETWSLRL